MSDCVVKRERSSAEARGKKVGGGDANAEVVSRTDGPRRYRQFMFTVEVSIDRVIELDLSSTTKTHQPGLL